MKVGDYVRLDRCQGINKIDEEDEIGTFYLEDVIGDEWGDETFRLDTNDVIKSSPNILDLIEVGDVLVVKDFVDEACMIFTDIYLIQNEQQLINIKSDLEKNKNKKLYSIVTSEQFSQMEYRIGE